MPACNRIDIPLTLILSLGVLACTGPEGEGGGDGGPGSPGDADAGPTDPNAPDAGDPEVPAEPRLEYSIDISHHTRTITDTEVDCFWENDIRHIIVGTQEPEVSRMQLQVAIRGGMLVDLYIFLNWWESMDEQVQEALDLAAEFPQVQRIWLDIEEEPNGKSYQQMHDLIDEAIGHAGGFPLGIYTGAGWWRTYFQDTTDYAEYPLWYARYDGSPNLADWDDPEQNESFGGWVAPTGKQYDDHIPGLCSLAVDDNIMWVSALPEVVVDRSVPPDDGDPPDAPVALLPNDGTAIHTEYVKPTAPPVRESTSYTIEIQDWDGDEWEPYWTTNRPSPDLVLFPVHKNRSFRWRVRGTNAHGDGPWSVWAWFNFGNPSSQPAPDQIQD